MNLQKVKKVKKDKKVNRDLATKEIQVKVIKVNQDHLRKVIKEMKVTKDKKVNRAVVVEELLEVISRFNSMIVDLLLVQMD